MNDQICMHFHSLTGWLAQTQVLRHRSSGGRWEWRIWIMFGRVTLYLGWPSEYQLYKGLTLSPSWWLWFFHVMIFTKTCCDSTCDKPSDVIDRVDRCIYRRMQMFVINLFLRYAARLWRNRSLEQQHQKTQFPVSCATTKTVPTVDVACNRYVLQSAHTR